MAKWNDFYGGNYLKASDVEKPTIFTIVDVQPEKLRGEDRPKLVATLKETDKQFVLNATNAATLEEIFDTDDYEEWRGKIVIYPDRTDFGGKRVPCLRCRAPKKKVQPVPDDDEDLAEFEE